MRKEQTMVTAAKKKKLPYYLVDTGFFEHKIKICFSDAAFQEALKASKITTRHTSLDVGVAESHHLQQEGTQYVLIAIVFDLVAMQTYDSLEKIGIIVHECVHTVTHMFQHIGEDDTKVGDETRAYFTEYIFKQIFAAFATEEDKRERSGKTNREILSKKGQGIRGPDVQVDQHSGWRPRPYSATELEGILRGAQGGDGETVTKTNPRV